LKASGKVEVSVDKQTDHHDVTEEEKDSKASTTRL